MATDRTTALTCLECGRELPPGPESAWGICSDCKAARVGGTGPAVQSSMSIGEAPSQGSLMATQGPPDITPPLTKAPSFQSDVMSTWKEV